MSRHSIGFVRTAALLAGLAFATAAHAVPVYDNGGPLSGGNAHELSSFVAANDFVLAEETTLLSLSLWASVPGGDTFAGNFSGTLGWALFSDSGTLPGALLFSGQDSTVITTATGLANIDGGEIVKVDADFTPNITLAAGVYWLALHEGNWGSAFDGSEIFWQRTATLINDPIRIDPNETAPGSWPLVSQFDGAFTLEGRATDEPSDSNNPNDPNDPNTPNDPNESGEPGGPPHPGSTPSMPEPASALLGLLSVGMLGWRRRRM